MDKHIQNQDQKKTINPSIEPIHGTMQWIESINESIDRANQFINQCNESSQSINQSIDRKFLWLLFNFNQLAWKNRSLNLRRVKKTNLFDDQEGNNSCQHPQSHDGMRHMIVHFLVLLSFGMIVRVGMAAVRVIVAMRMRHGVRNQVKKRVPEQTTRSKTEKNSQQRLIGLVVGADGNQKENHKGSQTDEKGGEKCVKPRIPWDGGSFRDFLSSL